MESLRLRLYEWSVHWDYPYCFLRILFGTACFILCLLPPTRCPGSTRPRHMPRQLAMSGKPPFQAASDRQHPVKSMPGNVVGRSMHLSIHLTKGARSMDPIICQKRLINLPPRRLTATCHPTAQIVGNTWEKIQRKH